MRKRIDLTDKVFDRLTVIEEAPLRNGRTMWKCQWLCGKIKEIRTDSLRSKGTLSCGCFHREQLQNILHKGYTHKGLTTLKHGHTANGVITTEYATWRDMLSRCYNPNNKDYKDYGGRGIKVCDEWRFSFENFYKDLGNKPKELTLDRKNVNGDYSSENCRWSSVVEQARNRRSNVWLEYKNKRMIQKDWAIELGINPSTLSRQLKKYNLQEIIDKRNKKPVYRLNLTTVS